ncbi:hypothetical protein ACLESO_37730 [Pyxidicoccus sp. 3LG]
MMRSPSLAEKSYGNSDAPGSIDLMERLSSLVREARSAPDSQRASVVAHLNASMGRLTSEVAPAEGAAFLHRLLGEGLLDGLEDEDGLPSSIAATRILLELGYPHALEVAPERLEALRRWKQRPPSVPWVGIAVTLFLAFVAQVAFITLGTPDRHLYNASVEALSGGLAPVPQRTLMAFISRTAFEFRDALFLNQAMANLVAFLMAVSVARWQRGHWLTRRAFFGLAALGLVVGGFQWPWSGWVAMSTWTAAAASLVSGWWMKER